MSASKVFRLTARDLYPHPLLDRAGVLPDLIARETRAGNRAGAKREDHKARAADLAGEFGALVADVAERGIQTPLTVVKGLCNWLIADGRNRWEAYKAAYEADPETAARLEAEGIPCVEIPDEEVPATVLSAMTRRHMSKQARALMAVKVFPEVAEEAKSGRPAKSGIEYPITQPAMAERIGVSLEVMKDACLFWRKLKLLGKPADAEDLIQQVFAGISFRDAELGQKGREATKGQPRADKKPWLVMSRNAGSIKLLWKDFEQIEDEERKLSMVELLADALTAAPQEVKPLLIAALEGGEP